MTLKGFHIVFITASIILSLLFSVWAYHSYTIDQAAGYLLTAFISIVFAIALCVYEFKFVKKIKL